MTIVSVFVTFIYIETVYTIANKPNPTFTKKSPMIIMTLSWDLSWQGSLKAIIQVKSFLCIDMTLMCLTLAFIYIETSLTTCIKSINAFTSITAISVFACGIWIAYIFKHFTKIKSIWSRGFFKFTIRWYLYSHINHAHRLHNRQHIHIHRTLWDWYHHLGNEIFNADPYLHYYDMTQVNYIDLYESHLDL